MQPSTSDNSTVMSDATQLPPLMTLPVGIPSAVLDAVQRACVANTLEYIKYAADGAPIVLAAASTSFIERYEYTDREPVTLFHSKDIPALTLRQLFRAVQQRADDAFDFLDDAMALRACALMLRFTETTAVPVTMAMMHRLFLSALVEVLRAHHPADAPSNEQFAEIIGTDAWEVDRLTGALRRAVSAQTFVSDSDVAGLVNRHHDPANVQDLRRRAAMGQDLPPSVVADNLNSIQLSSPSNSPFALRALVDVCSGEVSPTVVPTTRPNTPLPPSPVPTGGTSTSTTSAPWPVE